MIVDAKARHAPYPNHIANPQALLPLSVRRFPPKHPHPPQEQKDAFTFNQPADPIAVPIAVPRYFNIISEPTDFSTIHKKLAASNAAKKPESATAPSTKEPCYFSALVFFADLDFIFDAVISSKGRTSSSCNVQRSQRLLLNICPKIHPLLNRVCCAVSTTLFQQTDVLCAACRCL